MADFAARNKVFFLASEPLTDAIVWEQGNHYTFRLRPSTYMQAKMLVEEAAKLPAKRWATVAPNYEYGQSAVADFMALLKEKRPDVAFVEQQWPALGKLDAGPTVQALEQAKPDAIFNATFAGDLAKLVREGNTRGLFKKRAVVSALTGEPNISTCWPTKRPRAGSSPAIPGTTSRRPSTASSSKPIWPLMEKTRAWGRWSATTP